jgi:hypothetical protein
MSQEYKSLKKYKKETGSKELQEGCWLTKDRKKETLVWKEANRCNLQSTIGSNKYRSISQIRDFYRWYDQERKLKGHEVEWMGYAALASSQFAKLENTFLRVVVVNNKEVVKFVEQGSYTVFEFAFPLLKEVYFSDKKLRGVEAFEWDIRYGEIEQCQIIEPLYQELSEKALKKINRMAQGKGIYSFGVPKKIRFKGEIGNCEDRVHYIITKIKPYYRERGE